MKILEHTEARYDIHEVEMGVVYRWRPGSMAVECDCGERTSLTVSMTICGGCGTDHEAVVRGGLSVERLGDEVLHPWHYAGDREAVGLPY